MGPLDRGLVFLYSSTLTVVILGLGLVQTGWQYPLSLFRYELETNANQEILWVLMAVYIIMGLRIIWASVKPQHRIRQALVHEGGMGQVRVSLDAIEALAEKTTSAVPGVKEVKAKVVSSPKGVALHLKLISAPDVNIPEMSENIQHDVKESILNVVGLAVLEVLVAVESFKIARPRVE